MTPDEPEPRIISLKSIKNVLRQPFIVDDDVKAALEGSQDPYNELRECDSQGHTPLHVLAANARESCIEVLLTIAGEEAPNLIALQDNEGNTPLHLCANYPMICYQLAAEAPAACLIKNKTGVSPIDLARQHGSGEALNALLLACSGNSSPDVIDSMTELTNKGAVADTWAPNGQSSLMLAAAANSAKAITLLLSAGASLELQDAMGRTALMWAAGSDSVDALKVLLDAGASLALRDRRNRSACDYAEQPEAKKVLEAKVKELESKAAAAQEALLAELVEEEERKAASKASKKAKKKEKKKEKKGAGNSGVSGGVKDGAGETSSGIIDNEAVEETQILVESAEEEQIEGTTETETSSIKATTATTTVTADVPLPTPSTATVEVHPDTTTTKTPVVVSAPLNIAATTVRPPSPEWYTVGSAKKEKQLPPLPGTTNSAAKSAFHAHQHHHQYQHRRSPSVGSVTSISSGTSSHETDGSSIGGKHSGSERSVLRRVAAVGASSLGTSVPRLPAPVQRQAVCTRSTSGGEEVGAAFLFGTDGGASNSGGSGSSGSSTFKPGSWASIAASQKSSGTTKASISGAPGAPAFTTAPQEYHQQQPHENRATLVNSVLSLPGGDAAAWATISGTNTLTTPSGGSSIDGSTHSNYNNNNSSITVTTAPITISPASAVALQRAAAEEIAALRSEIQRLKLKNAAAELAHHQELVAILQDASQHENAAVLKATSDERLACSIRFAALLQNNGVALAGAIPGLLAGAGITSASDLDIFMNASSGVNNANNGINSGASSSARAIASGNLNNNNLNLCSGGGAAAAADVSPLSTSPFSYEVGEHLRGDFFGNHSAFMVPAIETHTSSMSACSPPEGGHVAAGGGYSAEAGAATESFMSKAVSTSAWSPLGNGTSSVWGSAIR